MDPTLARIFLSNAQWAEAVNAAEPRFFEQSAEGQAPKVRPFCPRSAIASPLSSPLIVLISVLVLADPLAWML